MPHLMGFVASLGLVAPAGLPAWLLKAAMPPLPARDGRTVSVSTVEALTDAVRGAAPGDTILVADGVYLLRRSLWLEGKERVTVRGASGDAAKVVIRGGGWDGGDPRDILVIRSSKDVVVADLTFTEARSYGIKVEALDDEPHPADVHVLRCRFRDIGVRAIKGTGPKDRKPLVGGSVRFCTFENTRVPDRSWLFNGDYISAIDMMYLKDWTFSNNLFRDIRGANGGGRGAIFVWNQSRGVVVERNVFVNCDRAIAFGNPSEPTNYEPGTLHNYDGVIRNNFIVAGPDGGKGIEVCWAGNVKVYHNTVCSPNPQYRGIHVFQKIHEVHVANNLVRGRILGEEDWHEEGNVTGALEGCFAYAASGDLHLTERAAEALGKGIPLPDVPDDIDSARRGNPPDAGADER